MTHIVLVILIIVGLTDDLVQVVILRLDYPLVPRTQVRSLSLRHKIDASIPGNLGLLLFLFLHSDPGFLNFGLNCVELGLLLSLLHCSFLLSCRFGAILIQS